MKLSDILIVLGTAHRLREPGDALRGRASGMVPVIAAYGISLSDSTRAQSEAHAIAALCRPRPTLLRL